MPDINSFQLPQEFLIVGAAARVGLFDEIKKEPCTLDYLAIKTASNSRSLWVIVEALVALGYLEYIEDKVKLTKEAWEIFYDPQHENYTGFSFMHGYNLMSAWLQLPEVIKSGKPAVKKRGPEQSVNFIKAMSHYAVKSAPQVVEYCLKGLPAGAKVLDVGGGPLTYANAFAKQGAKVVVLDLPEVVDMMQPELAPALSITMCKGDFTKGLPQGPYNLVYLGNVCHIYGEDINRELFKRAADELLPGGRIVINDMIRGTSPRAALFGVNMLVNTISGGTWTYQQYKTWLEDTGLLVAPYEEIGGRQLILAAKK